VTIKRVYVDANRLDRLIVYLSKKPTGTVQILIGNDTTDDMLTTVLARLTAQDHSLTRWVVKKVEEGELEIKVSERTDLPEGIELLSDTEA
jgi:hypothetical protein